MGFLIKQDFQQIIPITELDEILQDNDANLIEAMNSSEEEVKSYIRQRYNVLTAMPSVYDWTFEQTFSVNDEVILSADAWKNQDYVVGDLVYYENGSDDVYRCILNTTSKQDPTDATYWVAIGKLNQLYTVILEATGQYPNNDTYFEEGDNRNKLLVRLTADITLYELHSRINPRNIPEFRIQRRDDAVDYLRRVADPRNNIELDLPLVDHGDQKGLDISYGTTTNNNNY